MSEVVDNETVKSLTLLLPKFCIGIVSSIVSPGFNRLLLFPLSLKETLPFGFKLTTPPDAFSMVRVEIYGLYPWSVTTKEISPLVV